MLPTASDNSTVPSQHTTDSAGCAYRDRRRAFWDRVARSGRAPSAWSREYHRRLEEIYRFLIPPGSRVLELGCGAGDLLAAVAPDSGVGVDLSPAMIARARERHPRLQFIEADVLELADHERFDVIILSDLVNDLWDVQATLEHVVRLCYAGTRLLVNLHSRLWELPLRAAQRLGLAQPLLDQNWLTVDDMVNLLHLAGFEMIRAWQEVLMPARVPLLAPLANRVIVKSWPFNWLALTNFIVARPSPHVTPPPPAAGVSIVVPARNEAGNIDAILTRVPPVGTSTELIFVEGHSTDDTYAAIERAIAAHPERRCLLLHQEGEGKADAVRLGFERASGDVLMILDADLTVAPEDLPRFFEALHSGRGEFVNGVRLVYPMEDRAMRFLNLVGNKFFSLTFSWLLGQPIKDTLCGTKVLWKSDYRAIAASRSYFGALDPFGDFELLFGAAKLNKRIVEMPIRYAERTYGKTNIRRWVHGWMLVKMATVAARRLKWA
jgi:SAM-dependent methyltransferase